MTSTRRGFVQGLCGSAGLIALPRFGFSTATTAAPSVLRGPSFDLDISEIPVNITGAPRFATVVNGQLPAPQLRMREGDEVTIRVTNRLKVRTSIHWHGLIVPADMDGVPGISFHGIAPGETFVYRFKVNQSGTYWYHAHSRFQEQTGLYGSIVVEPRNKETHAADREHVILLSDWTDADPEAIYRRLKVHAGYFNHGKRTVADLERDVTAQGWKQALADRRMWGDMRMDPTDLSDVSGYTFLLNGTTPSGNWSMPFRPHERVRLRIINGSSMTLFDVRIPDLKLTVVAADGQDVEPVTVDEFRIAPAETYDVIVHLHEARPFTFFAQSIDRSGYARGTLMPVDANHSGHAASDPIGGKLIAIPPLDPRAELSMSDMGMSHWDSGTHSGHSMPGNVTHARDEFGPYVDMRVDAPNNRLDDPGVGLRNNGRRVLNYADLHTIGGPIDSRAPGREIELHLTGHMERFVWSFNGQKFSDAEPLRFRHGERLRVVLVNDTMMNHPIHLHGMWSEVESPHGQFQVRKHTVLVQPAQRLSYAVTADALGRWAYHCHMLYHMEAGMFREVVVSRDGAAS